MPGVLTWRPNTQYHDCIETTYRYPTSYDRAISEVGLDWIIYHRSQRSGLPSAYIGVGRVVAISDGPARDGMMAATISDYLEFDQPVPFSGPDGYREEVLRGVPPTSVGRMLRGNSIRSISRTDFAGIVWEGLGDLFDGSRPSLYMLDEPELAGGVRMKLSQSEFVRRYETVLTNRPIRSACFRANVRTAYDYRCAVTGLRLRNGGGRPEVDAAHIQAVADGGPDVVTNGLALCKTAHWLFDRGLITVRDDYSLYVSDNKVPSELRDLIGTRHDRIHLPTDANLRPDPVYLRHRRERHMAF